MEIQKILAPPGAADSEKADAAPTELVDFCLGGFYKYVAPNGAIRKWQSERLTIKGNYLLFFDKKDLTNGIDWFIPCTMNANEISAKNNSQVNRIRKVSVIFRVIFFCCLCPLFSFCYQHMPCNFCRQRFAVRI